MARPATELEKEIIKLELGAAHCTIELSRRWRQEKANTLRHELRMQQMEEWAGEPPADFEEIEDLEQLLDPEVDIPQINLPSRFIEESESEEEEENSGPVLEPEIDIPFKVPPKEPEVTHLTEDQFHSLLGLVVIGVVLATLYQFVALILKG